jgi:hypothetical protein
MWPPYLTERPDEHGDIYPVNESRHNARGPVMGEEEAKAAGWIGPVWHGTTKRRAADIKRGGFRQPRLHNWEMSDAGGAEEVDAGNTHRTFFAKDPQLAWDHAVGNHGKDNAALVKVYLHPDHIETDSGGGWVPSLQVRDVAHAAAIPEHITPPVQITDERDSAEDPYHSHPPEATTATPGRTTSAIPPMAETAGLPSAIAYAGQLGQSAHGLGMAAQRMQESLTGHGLAGESLDTLSALQELLGAAEGGLDRVQSSLGDSLGLREAWQAQPDAGDEGFLLDHVLAHGEHERAALGHRGHRGGHRPGAIPGPPRLPAA